ncbi:hypothetical protein DDZ18_11105 [Marinicauda salina]|uniref:Uncharacterized protein n=1 Tax=Marinicauda salina TaxID=2135793 RepID=A0A2U2BRU8_9PROT|nr:hypothetical protein [Marinicauda salina]PWE16744.1 hypothetical protein DDZ18_11105 [Marinicauda salina]
MNSLKIILAAGLAAATGGAAAAQSGGERALQQLQVPQQILDAVIEQDEEAPQEESQQPQRWVEGESAIIPRCADPSVGGRADRLLIACGEDSEFNDHPQLRFFEVRFDYGADVCPGAPGQWMDHRIEAAPSAECAALWRRADAQKADFRDLVLRAAENGWGLELAGRKTRQQGVAVLTRYHIYSDGG